MPKKKHNRNKKGKGSNNANAAAAPRTDESSINNANRDSDDVVAEFMSNTDRALKEFDKLTDEEKQNRGTEDMAKVRQEILCVVLR
jgi:hypothetical protein